MDKVTKTQRSRNMSAVKSRNNLSTEIRVLKLLREAKLTGWRRHYKKLRGVPDFVFPKYKIAVFVDGCFWHGCEKHRPLPRTNSAFWKEKISRNKERDKETTKTLKSKGWKVIRIWEHNLGKRNVLKRLRLIIK